MENKIKLPEPAAVTHLPEHARRGERAMSFIEDSEEAAARELIDKQFVEMTGKPFDGRVAGFMIAVKLYVLDDKIGSILLTDQTREDSKYQSVAGLVVGMGPQAYQGDRYPEGPWCKVGDWILLPRYEATMLTFRGVAMGMIPDDRVQMVIEDPRDVQSITATARI